MNKIDVCCVTKNELPDYWKKNLDRLPVNNLIIERSKPLGMARMRAIQKVTTEWFLFLDDDALVGKNFWNIMSKHMVEGVGAIDGRVQMCSYNKDMCRILNSSKKSIGDVADKHLGERGITVCTLLRLSAVADWLPSQPDVTSWEDYEITQHVLKKGYRWLDVYTEALHVSWNWLRIPKQEFWDAEGYKKVKPRGKYSPLPYLVRLLLKLPLDLIFLFFMYHEYENHRSDRLKEIMFYSYVIFWFLSGILFSSIYYSFKNS